MAWCLFSVSQYDELKMDKYNEVLVYVCILNDWKNKLANKHDTVEEYNCLKKIEKTFEQDFYEKINKKSKNLVSYKEDKLFKKGPSMDSIIELNRLVIKKNLEYRMSTFNFQREMLSAIYYREANKAVENSDQVIESEFNPYFERAWIFKKFPKFGKVFVPEAKFRNFLLQIHDLLYQHHFRSNKRHFFPRPVLG